jgi:hypothetical protein
MSLPPSSRGASSINDDKQSVPSTTAESLTGSSKDDSFSPLDSDATTAQPSNLSRLTRRPDMPGAQDCISAVGDFYQNVPLRRYMEGTTQVTEMILPNEEPTPGSVVIVPFRKEFDWHASGLVVNGRKGQKRYSFAQLGSIERGSEITGDVDRPKGWLAYGDVKRDDWTAEGLIVWGDHESVDNGDGTKSIKYRQKV